MTILKKISYALILTLIASLAFAQQSNEANQTIHSITLMGNSYGRSAGVNSDGSFNFNFGKNQSNVMGLIPLGSTGEFLRAERLTRNTYAIQVRLTKIKGRMKGKVLKEGDTVWVHYSSANPHLSFKDENNYEIEDPEEAFVRTLATASDADSDAEEDDVESGNEDDPNLAKNPDKTKTEADFCAAGLCEDPKNPSAKNREDLKDVAENLVHGVPKDPLDPWKDDPYISNFSYSPAVQNAIDRGMKYKKKRSVGKCWRFTKLALRKKRTMAPHFEEGDLVDDYPEGTFARNGVAALKKLGWTNLLENPKYSDKIKTPEDAPKGAVLIYKNTRDAKHPGHAEIKTDFAESGGYVSDFFRPVDKPLRSRKLIGVMIKEGPL